MADITLTAEQKTLVEGLFTKAEAEAVKIADANQKQAALDAITSIKTILDDNKITDAEMAQVQAAAKKIPGAENLNGWIDNPADETEQQKLKDAKLNPADPMQGFMMMIFSFIAQAFGLDPAAFGLDQTATPEATAAPASAASEAAAATPTALYPSPIDDAGRVGGFLPDTKEARIAAQTAEFITRYASQNPGQLLENPAETTDQIKANLLQNLQTQAVESTIPGENLTKDYYKAAARASALEAISNAGWVGNYAVEGLQIWDYAGLQQDKDLARETLKAFGTNVAALNPAYEAIGLTGGNVRFEKGAIVEGQANSFSFNGPASAIENAQQEGKKQAEIALLDSYRQGVIPTFEATNLNAMHSNVGEDITQTQAKIKSRAFEREKLIATIGMHEARIELNDKLSATPEIGQNAISYSGLTTENDIRIQAVSASAQHQMQKDLALKQLAKLDAELSKDVSKLVDLNKRFGELEQQLEYAKGNGLVSTLNAKVGEITAVEKAKENAAKKAAEKAEKEAAEKAERDRKEAADKAKFGIATPAATAAPASVEVTATKTEATTTPSKPLVDIKLPKPEVDHPSQPVQPIYSRVERYELDEAQKQLARLENRAVHYSKEAIGAKHREGMHSETIIMLDTSGMNSNPESLDKQMQRSADAIERAENARKAASTMYLNQENQIVTITRRIAELERVGMLRGELEQKQKQLEEVSENLAVARRGFMSLKDLESRLNSASTEIYSNIERTVAAEGFDVQKAAELSRSLTAQADVFTKLGADEASKRMVQIAEKLMESSSKDGKISPDEKKAISDLNENLVKALNETVASEIQEKLSSGRVVLKEQEKLEAEIKRIQDELRDSGAKPELRNLETATNTPARTTPNNTTKAADRTV